jgi:aspartyl-tRNA(Asn)/glutamyl-tRNA(Gln) amidotransferase subunit A
MFLADSFVPLRRQVADLAAGRVSAESLLEAARAREQVARPLNPMAHLDWQAALERARELDRQARERPAGCGPLHGLPISIKDLFVVRGMPMRAGTRAALPDLGRDEAEAVARLRAAGALIFGKTNMHELALGATGENVWTGDVCNPWDPARQAGGSSSGAAVAVATGIGVAAVGSDTGGSVRIPAAFCGVAGFKPTYQAIPLAGALHLSFTCDHAGPLAPSVDDCALLFEVMAGRRTDHGAVPRRPRLAVPRSWLTPRMDGPVARAFAQALEALERAGAEIDDVDLAGLALAWEHYTPLVRAEAAWVHRAALAAGDEGFSDLVRPPLQAGVTIPAGAYIDALRAREAVRAEFGGALRTWDAFVLPTSPVLPPRRGQMEVEVAAGRTMSTREAVLGQTLAFSFAGLPALALPMGTAEGLPVSLQLVGAEAADARLLALGCWAEAAIGPATRA